MRNGARDGADAAPRWWQRRPVALAFVMLGAVPLLWPAIPPLTDLPGHIGRFRIMAEAGQGPLAQHYHVTWKLIGNFGVDGLVLLLAPLLGLEPAAKLVVLAIPMLSVAAMLWLSREVHGRIPPTTAFALPLAYAAPFQFGFVNFSLAVALVIAALALWLRLARRSPAWLRVLLFVPIAALVWLCHAFGWALLGLFVLGAELALRRERGQGWGRAAVGAALMCAPMALPVLVIMATGGDAAAGATGRWFDIPLKLHWATSLLRERWQLYDVLSALGLFFLVIFAWRSPRLSFAPLLAVPAAFGALAFLLLPAFYAGGSYVDMRVLPATLMLGLLAIRVAPGNDRFAGHLAALAASFFVLRLATSTVALALFAQGQAAALAGIDAIPQGAAVLVLVDEPAADNWNNPRLAHIAGLAVARRRLFTNEQWALAGQQLVTPLHPTAAPYDRDPSQLVYPATVKGGTDFDSAIATFDRGTFGYVWTIGFPPGRARAADLAPLSSDGRTTIYRVVSRR
ncbi:MAG: hypothetical protein WC804_05325 [Sphingomonas sp.]|jgi:hypothetical protein|uniref:hypothetical protein n=1 Tax=Sphingomonas sp. TaxID=28214 RepID=UPI0035666450